MSMTREALEEVLNEEDAMELDAADEEAAFLASYNEDEDYFLKAEEEESNKTDESNEFSEEEEVTEEVQEEEEATSEEEQQEEVQELDPLQELENRLATRLRNVEGHIGGLKSQLQAALAAKEEAKEYGEDAPTNAQIKAATGSRGSTEKLEALKEEFPEWADALDEQVDYLQSQFSQGSNVDLAGFKDEMMQTLYSATQQNASRLREILKVDAVHPGWEEDIETPDYKYWKDGQPEDIQALADSPKAADAIRMLDLYKQYRERTEVSARKDGASKQRLERAVSPKTNRSAPAPRVPSEEEEFLAAFNGN